MNLASSLLLLASGLMTAQAATVIYSDNFDDNTNTGWTYINRDPGGTPDPSFAEQNGQLEQTSLNYSFPSPGGSPALGAVALSGAGTVGDQFTIDLTMNSLEEGNGFQDQSVIFGYQSSTSFWYMETSAADNGAVLFEVNSSGRQLRSGILAIGGFSHATVPVSLEVDTLGGTVTFNYDNGTDVSVTGLTLQSGQVGVGSNNDAFAIDDFVVTQIPEPGIPALLAPLALLGLSRRRR